MPLLDTLGLNASNSAAADDAAGGSFGGLSNETWDVISQVIGWIYFAVWSVSFYPQVYINWSRKSVAGLSFDFVSYNILGFVCLSIFTGTFYWSPYIQDAYRERFDGKSNLVQANDVFFALHAVALTAVTLTQIYFYGKAGKQKVSLFAIFYTSAAVIASIVYSIVGLATHGGPSFWLDFVYFLSYVKLSLTFFKYLPQVYLNWLRKSTVGWSIVNVLLLFLDAAVSNNWTGISGDPVKIGLGFLTIFFDIVFILQHYVLYPERTDFDIAQSKSATTSGKLLDAGDSKQAASDRTPLLIGSGGERAARYSASSDDTLSGSPNTSNSGSETKSVEHNDLADDVPAVSHAADNIVEDENRFKAPKQDSALDDTNATAVASPATGRQAEEGASSPLLQPGDSLTDKLLYVWHRLTCQLRECDRCRRA